MPIKVDFCFTEHLLMLGKMSCSVPMNMDSFFFFYRAAFHSRKDELVLLPLNMDSFYRAAFDAPSVELGFVSIYRPVDIYLQSNF